MKRIFVVLVVIIMFLVTGCQGVSVVDAKVDETGQLILYMSDGSSINAGMVKGEDGADGKDGLNGKDGADGRDGADGADGVGIAKAAVNDSGDLMIRLTDDTLINAGEVKGKDGRDGIDGIDGKDGRDGKDGKDGKDGNNIEPSDLPVANVIPEPASSGSPVTTSAYDSPSPFITDSNDSRILVKYIGQDAHVTIPDHILEIEDGAFRGNTTLHSVTLPGSITSIGAAAFMGCTSLSSVGFSDDGSAEDSSDLKNISFPSSLKSIDKSAFQDSGLSGSVCFYGNITIFENAFSNTDIEEIILDPESKITLTAQSNAFAYCTKLNTLKYLNLGSSLDLDDNAFLGCGDLNVYVKNKIAKKTFEKDYSASMLGISGSISFPSVD